MEAILLGSAGNHQIVLENSNAIPIPTSLPNDPVVLIEQYSLPTQYIPGDNLDTTPVDTIINRINGYVMSVIKGSKTITITRDINNVITSISDGVYQRNITRSNGLVTGVTIVTL